MRRTVSNTLCAMLVLVSYLWGGCVNCEQLFMAQEAMPAMPDCCQHGQCDRESQPDAATGCEKVAWDQAPPQDSRTLLSHHAASVAVAVLEIPDLIPAPIQHTSARPVWRAGDSPPDLPVLYASLLI